MTSPLDPARDEAFETLWTRFEEEGGFRGGEFDAERTALRAEIAGLEATLAQRREALGLLDQREETARQQLRSLLGAGLGDDAILSAMKVQYGKPPRTRRAKGPAQPATTTLGDEDKAFVLGNLDKKGRTLGELSKSTQRESSYLSAVLKLLLAEGRVTKTGTRRASRYHLAD